MALSTAISITIYNKEDCPFMHELAHKMHQYSLFLHTVDKIITSTLNWCNTKFGFFYFFIHNFPK